jgi:hypothetical protein
MGGNLHFLQIGPVYARPALQHQGQQEFSMSHGDPEGEIIRFVWESPDHGFDPHREFTANSAGDIIANPLTFRTIFMGVAANVDGRSEDCESCENEECELHCEVANSEGEA